MAACSIVSNVNVVKGHKIIQVIDRCTELNDQVIRPNDMSDSALVSVWGLLETPINTLSDVSFGLIT